MLKSKDPQVISDPFGRNFKQEEPFSIHKILFSNPMESLSPQVVAAAKLPILNPNEFDLWKMRIEQFFLMTDYSLWEVILNCDSPTPTRVINGVVQAVASTTAEQKLAKKNELKARGTLLMALPDKHQLKFNIHKDVKSLMEATKKSVSAASTKPPASILPNVDNLSDAVIYSFFASQSNSPQLDYLKQIDANDLEEVDLKWQMAMLTMRARRYLQRTGRNLGANETYFIGFDMSKVECYNCYRRVETSTSNALVSQYDGVGGYDWSFQTDEEPTNYALMAFTFSSSSSPSSSDTEVASCSKACTKAYATLQSHYDKLTIDLRKSQFDVLLYKTGLEYVEARLMFYQQNENVFEEDIKLLKLDVMLRDNALVELRKKFKKAKKREELKLTLEKLQTSSKNLSKLLKSQITNKTGLGYDNQVFNSIVFDCDELNSFESDVSMLTSLVYDRYKAGEGYHVVPPPYIGNFMPPKPDLVFHNAPAVSETVPNVLNVEPKDKSEGEPMPTQKEPSFVKTFEHVKTPRTFVKPVELPTQAKKLRKDIPKPRGHKHSWNMKAYFICKSVNHLIKDCDYYKKMMVQKPVWNHAMWVNHQNSARMTHPHSKRHVIRTAVLTWSRLVPLNVARPVTTIVPQTHVKHQRPVKHVVNNAHSLIRWPINHIPAPKHRNFNKQVTTIKGNPRQALKDKGVIDSHCSRHLTRNISYLSDFKELNGGYVAFGGNPKGGNITGKGKIRTSKLDFDDVYFVKELKFNLFSVSQMCDKKNGVLFIDTECVVLSYDFKLPDENYVLLRVLRENNMYNVDLKNVVPLGDLTCLFTKDTLDVSNLWHRRLGHINFKTMNKLVKGNIVRGLSLKVFVNNHTCVACKKGKQHKASCKSKPVSFVNQPLQRLHIDLLRPTFVKSLNKKSYCLVVTDDYSRFSWVFFLATKDETSTILKTFITGLENQIYPKVKIIRSENGTEFQNHDLNQFCRIKGMKGEFSVARNPQQNGVVKRKNRILIEAARTMLVDSLLPIPFWAEAVNTACYVQNRVLVTKPHNKTPYELLLCRTPSIGFMRPFGCPVTILNTLDPPGKFDRKADEGFLVGYYVSSKAFRVFNSRARIVQETLHINFLENQRNVARSGPTWLFDIDTLTQSMNYQPVAIGNQPNSSAGIQRNFNVGKVGKESFSTQQYVLLPFWSTGSKDPQNIDVDDAFDNKKNESEVHVSLSNFSSISTNMVNAASAPVTAAGPNSTNSTDSFSVAGPSDNAVSPTFEIDDEEYVGAEADFSNLETSITVSPIPITRVHKDHYVTKIIGDLSLAPQTRSMTRMVKEQAYASFMGIMVYQMDVKIAFLYETIEEEVYVCQPLGFKDPDYPDKVYKVVKALYGLHQALRAWYETLTNYLLENEFQRGKIDQTLFIKKQKVKMIFRYLKGKPNLGLWYPKDSLFNLVAYSDSDYARASLDRKSTTRGCQFLVRLQALIDKKNVIITEDTIRQALRLDDAAGVDCLPNEKIFVELARMGYEKPSTKLTFYKGSSMASAVICLATVDDLSAHNNKYTSPDLTQRVFMRRIGKGFSGVDTPLFDETCATLTKQVANLEQDKITQAIDITKLKKRVRRRVHLNRGKIAELDVDDDVTLVDAEVAMDANDTDEAELAEAEEVIKVVIAAKLITEVVTTTAITITTAQVTKASAPRRRRGVVILDPKEIATALVIDEAFARELEAELNTNINWDNIMKQVKRKEKQNNTVMRYQVLKRKPITEAQARKNMMIYLKNMDGFKMDFCKGMTYNEIRPIFKQHYNLNQAFLERVKEEVIGQKKERNKRKGDSLNQDAAKK
nr:putative ribonuclease H-like domain-containing protein [Tanacetum cinerariifolium]